MRGHRASGLDGLTRRSARHGGVTAAPTAQPSAPRRAESGPRRAGGRSDRSVVRHLADEARTPGGYELHPMKRGGTRQELLRAAEPAAGSPAGAGESAAAVYR
ncbi:hypothetical protein Slala05_50520 [Streptomyces lavendulae subsp. lavendulae]|nr:hypothetical protein Slala05_50520 [Streptomyces lavendulae subsp. lavendulae]